MNVIKSCRHGLMAYNTNDVWVGRCLNEYGEYSEAEPNLFRQFVKPGDVAVEVGSNIGAITVPLAKMVGPHGVVHAFEPQRMCFYLLCANVALNNITNVFCHQRAVGANAGTINVPELDQLKSNNFGGLSLTKDYNAPGSCSVRLTTIDDLKLPRLNFLKIDVEGMEKDVVYGAIETIKKFKPIIYLENDRPEQAAHLVNLLKTLEYKLYTHNPPMYMRNNYANNPNNTIGNVISVNLLGHHASQRCPVVSTELTELKHNQTQIAAAPSPELTKSVVDSNHNQILDALLALSETYSANLHQPDKAMEYIKTALTMSNDWRIYNQAAAILTRHVRYDEAAIYIEKAIDLGGDQTTVLFNKCVIESNRGNYEEAIVYCKELLKREPDNVHARFILASDLLITGRFEEGWEHYEHRTKLPIPAMQQFLGTLPKDKPTWDGKPLNGKRLLVYLEQGAGDHIQFCRYLKKIKGDVTLVCFKNLKRLFSCLNCNVVTYNDDMTIPDVKYDVMVSMASLPRIFGTTVDTIPSEQKYLEPSGEDKFEKWQYRDTFNVGIAWAGSEIHKNDFTRSCTVGNFRHLQMKGVRLFSLQKGHMGRFWQDKGHVNLLEGKEYLSLIDFTEMLDDFNDTAHLINKLDLVVAVDTSVVHLAGALGKPVWLLNGWCPDFRWLNGREDSPWYPSMKIFRNTDREKLFAEVKQSLRETVDGRFNI